MLRRKWLGGVFGVVALAGLLAGPGAAGAKFSGVTGAAPAPACNTTGLVATPCDALPGKLCGLNVSRCKQANPGVNQDKLCNANNGPIQCDDATRCVRVNSDAIADAKTNPCAAVIAMPAPPVAP
jgi:hypothetical protein